MTTKTTLFLPVFWITALGLSLGCSQEEEPAHVPFVPMPMVHVSAAEANVPAENPPRPGDPVNAITVALREPDTLKRVSGLTALVQNLEPEALPSVVKVLSNVWLELDHVEQTILLTFWSGLEPAEATEWATFEATASQRAELVSYAIESWAIREPHAALERIGRIMKSNSAVQKSAIKGLVRGWFASGQPGLEEYIRAMGEGTTDQQFALSALVREGIKRYGPEPVIRWAEAVPVPTEDIRFKLAVYRRLGRELAIYHPEEAKAWCAKQCDGPHGRNLRTVIARRWARWSPIDALDWLKSAGPGEERDFAVKQTFAAFVGKDREGAKNWVAEVMPADSYPVWFQPAVSSYASILAVEDPLLAAEVAGKIDLPAVARRSLMNTARKWLRKDPEAAEAWLAQSPLSEETRAMVLGAEAKRLQIQRRK